MTDTPTPDAARQPATRHTDTSGGLPALGTYRWDRGTYVSELPNGERVRPTDLTVEIWYGPLAANHAPNIWRAVIPDPAGTGAWLTVAILKIRVETSRSRAWFVAAFSHCGSYTQALHGIEYCSSPAEAARALKAGLGAIVQFTPKGGRKPGRVITRDQYEAERNRLLKDFPNQKDRVKALASRLSVSRDSIYRYHAENGWPL